jgi:hypothetical protein
MIIDDRLDDVRASDAGEMEVGPLIEACRAACDGLPHRARRVSLCVQQRGA